MKLSALHRKLVSSRRGRRIAAASCALAFAAGYAGRTHARPAPTQKTGTAHSASATAPPAHALPTADGPGKLLRLQGVRVTSKLENGRLVVNGLTGSVGGGRVNATGRLDAGDKAGAQKVQAQFDDVNLSEILSLLEIEVASAGVSPVRADGVINFHWRGMDSRLVRQSITGTATVKTGAGRISSSSPLLAKLGDAAGIQNLQSLSFDSCRIDLAASDGVVRINSLVLQGDEIRLAAAGVVDLRGNRLDMRMDVDVVPQLAERSKYYKLQGLASIFGRKKMTQTSDGFVEVPRIVLAGQLSKPDVRLDASAREVASQKSAQRETEAQANVDDGKTNARHVARQDVSTETKRVPLWRNVLSGLSDGDSQDEQSSGEPRTK